jgi:4-amino-4-deoxy-L-arabinose transferase-like glycosyltransferase
MSVRTASAGSGARNALERWVVVASLALAAGGYVLYVLAGRLHVDEGYYHLVPWYVTLGRLPYRDYLWVQPPVYPFVYAALIQVVGRSLLALRAATALLGFAALALALRTARRIGGTPGAALAGLLVAWAPFQLYYTTIVKLYALTALLLAAALDVLIHPRLGVWRWTAAAVLLALGTATRITLAPGLLVLLIGALVSSSGRRLRRPGLAGLAPAIAAVAVLAAIFGPWVLVAPEQLGFGLIGYHLAKESFSLPRQIIYKLDNASRFAASYPLLTAVVLAWGVAAVWSRRRRGGERGEERSGLPLGLAWGVILAVIAIHLTSQVPYAYRYLTVVVPAAGALIGGQVARRLSRAPRPLRRAAWVAALTMGACQFLGTVHENIPPLPHGAPALYLARVARTVAQRTSADRPILTINNSIAVEAGRLVLPGDEMNVLTYSPEWPEERCRKQHILNLEMLRRAIEERRFGAILITKDAFIGNFPVFFNPGEEGARPTLMQAIRRFYRLDGSPAPHLGYFDRPLERYLPRAQGEELPLAAVPRVDDRKPRWPTDPG